MRIGLGGGCHWCTEAVFQALHGVEKVEQGYIRSTLPHNDWSEAVIVHYDPALIALHTLIEVHLHTHSATNRHALRNRYRSAVYAFDDDQIRVVRAVMNALQDGFESDLVTEVLPFVAFRPSPERCRNYYRKHPDVAFSQRYIMPKLAWIRRNITFEWS